MSSTRPVRVTNFRGHVSRGMYARGSKSEREAVFLQTPDGRYIFRRKAGPALDDPEISYYVGHDVECDGLVIGTTFLAERVSVIN